MNRRDASRAHHGKAQRQKYGRSCQDRSDRLSALMTPLHNIIIWGVFVNRRNKIVHIRSAAWAYHEATPRSDLKLAGRYTSEIAQLSVPR